MVTIGVIVNLFILHFPAMSALKVYRISNYFVQFVSALAVCPLCKHAEIELTKKHTYTLVLGHRIGGALRCRKGWQSVRTERKAERKDR